MRFLITTAAIMLALIAFHPAAADAKDPGGGGSGGGSSSGGSKSSGQKNSGQKGNWNPNWHNNSHPGYGSGYRYAPYVVQRPILENPLPPANFSGGLIKISNPATNGVTLSYTLNGIPYTMHPGFDQEFSEDRLWTIEFSRGTNLGLARYRIESGRYGFASTDHGWELYRGPLEESPALSAPTNPPAPAPSLPQPVPVKPAPPQ